MATHTEPSKAVNYGLWALQGLLGMAFGMAGVMKLTTTQAELVEQGMAWAGRVPEMLIPFIGISELLGAIGLILPAALGILPRLTPLAAGLLALVMLLAAGEHAMAGEIVPAVIVNAVLGSMLLAVAYGRTQLAPIAARSASGVAGAAARA